MLWHADSWLGIHLLQEAWQHGSHFVLKGCHAPRDIGVAIPLQTLRLEQK